MKRPGVSARLRARRLRRVAQRAAERARRRREPAAPLRSSSLAEYAAAARTARRHVTFDTRGNVTTVEVDPARFAAALRGLDESALAFTERQGGSADADVVDGIDLAEPDDAVDVPLLDDDDCPICRAIRASAVGEPDRRWSLD